MDLTPKQQTSEAIRQAESILITTGQHPSVDQVSAVIALSAILRKFGKRVSAVISDSLPQSAQLLDTTAVDRNMTGLRDFVLKVDTTKAEVGDLRSEVAENKLNIYVTPRKGGFAPSDVTFDYGQANLDYDLAIILGVPTRARIDRVYEQNHEMFAQIPVINLDFHRSNENYGAVNLIEPNASSLCEMLVALAESLQGGIIDAEIATALLMGIVGSTDRFTAAHTTSKSLTVAAQMMAAGAKQQQVVKALYRDGGREGRGERGGNDRGGERNSNNDRNSNNADRSHAGREGGQRDGGRGEAQRQPRDNQGPKEPQGSREGQSARDGQGARDQTQQQRENRDQAQQRDGGQRENRENGSHQPREATPAAHAQPESAVVQQPTLSEQQSEPARIERAPQAEAQPVHQTQPAPQAQPTQPVTSAPTEADNRPFRVNEAMQQPIIDPGHIEFSEPEVPQPAAAQEPARSVVASAPLADFATAAETLIQRQAPAENTPDPGNSPA